MLVHDNGKICVLSATRCGHTSMSHYFDKMPDVNQDGVWTWLSSSSRKILVLRNPYDRLKSAIVNAEKFPYGEELSVTKEQWIDIHSRPYLINISQTIPFEIIDFYRLSEYIPMFKDTTRTNTRKIHRKDIPVTPELREEYKRYRYFLTYCRQISPQEWKELTENS